MISETASMAIEAYGGRQLWNDANKIEAVVSAKGLAFILKRRPAFAYARITLDVHKPHCRITPIGRNPNLSGVLEGGNVRLENQYGEIIAKRDNARKLFPYGRRLFRWDDLDMAYFANYAFWNYLTLPALLFNNEIIWKEAERGTLAATFPDNIPTHNQEQLFRFDTTTGLLIQHDYVAEVISKFASAANVVRAHATSNQITFPSSRLVTPRLPNGKPLKSPALIDMKIHECSLIK